MATMRKVPLYQKMGNIAVEDGATKGAAIGTTLFDTDGSTVTWDTILARVAAAGAGGGSTVPDEVYWRTIREVPVNVQALANLSTTGVYVVTAMGTSVTREVVPTVGRTTVSNGDGVLGDIGIDLAVVPDAGGGTLLRFARDAWGRVTGTSAATTDDLAEGSANLYFTDERAQDAVGAALLDTATVNLTYNDATGEISADAIPGGIEHNDLASIQDAPNAVTDEHYHLSSAQAAAVASAVVAGSGFVTVAGAQTVTGAKTFNATTTFAGVLGTANTQVRATDSSLNSLSTSAGAQPRIQVGATGPDAGTTNNRSGFGMGRFFNDSGAPAVYMVKSRGSSMNDNSVAVLNNDSVCQWFYEASNGAGLTRGARYQIMVDGAPSGTTVPMRHQWGTMNAAGTMADRWQIVSAGDLLPFADNAYNVGSGSLRVKEYFGAIGAINTSDEREKTERGPLTATELAAASELAADVSIYQWNDAIAAKGAAAARLHVGWIAQRVHAVMAAHGLDGFRYGFLCYDEWPEQQEVWHEWPAQDELIDEETGEILQPAIAAGRELVQPYRAAGNLYGLRKDELQAFIMAAQEQRIRALEAFLNAG